MVARRRYDRRRTPAEDGEAGAICGSTSTPRSACAGPAAGEGVLLAALRRFRTYRTIWPTPDTLGAGRSQVQILTLRCSGSPAFAGLSCCSGRDRQPLLGSDGVQTAATPRPHDALPHSCRSADVRDGTIGVLEAQAGVDGDRGADPGAGGRGHKRSWVGAVAGGVDAIDARRLACVDGDGAVGV